MSATPPLRPWAFLGGTVTAGIGLALLLASRSSAPPTVQITGLALISGALVELAGGFALRRWGRTWIAHVVSGALVPFLAVFLLSVQLLDPAALTPAPLALMLGLFCLINALVRALALLIDGVEGAVPEVADLAVTLVLAGVLLSQWRAATPAFVAALAGLELLAGGLTLAISARPPLAGTGGAHPRPTA